MDSSGRLGKWPLRDCEILRSSRCEKYYIKVCTLSSYSTLLRAYGVFRGNVACICRLGWGTHRGYVDAFNYGSPHPTYKHRPSSNNRAVGVAVGVTVATIWLA